MRRIIIIIAVIIIIACVAIPILIGPPGGRFGANSASAAAILQKATVDKGDLKLTVSATGNVVANQQSKLNFDQSGTVKEVLVDEGQRVDAEQLLARLDDTTQQSNLEQAQFSLKAADAALQKLLKPVD